MATNKAQRIAIAAIGCIMVAGTLGTYFIIILEQNNTTAQQGQSQMQQQQETKQTVDPTAFIVKGDVTELKTEDLTVGDGTEAKAGDTVRVHYKGTIAQTGAKFDSSYDRGEPISFGLNEVIAGWRDGIPGMKVGGKRRLIIPSDKAYGSQALPGIPADSDLIFEVELLSTAPKQ